MELQHQDELKELYKALAQVQSKINHASMDSNNPAYKSRYASLESVIDVIRPLCAEAGLLVIQAPEHCDGGLCLITRIAHVSGACIESKFKLHVDKLNMQGYGGAITYGRRYALASLFFIGQEDDDGNEISGANAKKEHKKEEPKKDTRNPEHINGHQVATIQQMLQGQNDLHNYILTTLNISSIVHIPANAYDATIDFINTHKVN